MNGSVLFEGNPILSGSLNVNTSGNIEPLEVEITENGTRTITPPSGVDGYAPITIETNVPTPPPVVETLNVTQNGTYTPPSGVDGYDEIIVNVSQEADIQPLTRTITTNGTTVINASDLNVDGFDPVTITTAVDGYTIKTLANTPLPIASFSDGTDNPLKSLTASIVPVQSGSGDPSPTNVRPISGWTEETITVTDDLQNPTVTHTTTIPFTDGQGQSVEVFGGSVNVNEGKVLVTHFRNKITSVTRSTSTTFFRNTTTAKGSQYGSRVKCDKFVSANTGNDVGVFVNNKGAVRFNTEKEYASASEFLEDYGGEINVVYERETPSELTFNPTSIKSLDGDNNVFASTGDVEELKYFANL